MSFLISEELMHENNKIVKIYARNNKKCYFNITTKETYEKKN